MCINKGPKYDSIRRLDLDDPALYKTKKKCFSPDQQDASLNSLLDIRHIPGRCCCCWILVIEVSAANCCGPSL